MSRSRRLALLTLGSMLSAAALAEWARPTIKDSDTRSPFRLDEVVPKSFGRWTFDATIPVIIPPPDQQAVLDRIYNQTLARTYVDREGRRIMLSMAFGGDQSDGLTVHLPEVCYVAQGFRLEWSRNAQLDLSGQLIPVREVLTTMNRRIEPVTYWIVFGDRPTNDSFQRRLVSLRYGLRRRIPEGLLVRVSSINAQVEQAFALHRVFVNDLVASLSPEQRTRVVGDFVSGAVGGG